MRDYSLSPAQTGITIGTIMIIGGPIGSVGAGYLSDTILRVRPHDGRMLIFATSSIPMTASLLLLTGSPTLPLTVAGLLSVKMVSSGMFGVGYTTVQESVPSSMRGLAVSIYVALTNIVGLSLGALLVGVATDYVFHDEARIRPALALVALPATSLAFVFALISMKPYADQRRKLVGVPDIEMSPVGISGTYLRL